MGIKPGPKPKTNDGEEDRRRRVREKKIINLKLNQANAPQRYNSYQMAGLGA